MQNDYINIFLNLKEVLVKNVCTSDEQMQIFIETKPKEQVCPCCQRKTSKTHDYREQVIKDIPTRYKKTILVLRKRRYRCDCGKRFYEKYDFIPRYQHMTRQLTEMIVSELRDVQSMTKVAKMANVSITTVIRILNKINYPAPTMPMVLSIDEFRGNAETGKFQCILVDGRKRKVLDILPTKSMAELSSYFRKIPKDQRYRVKYFVCDMCVPFVEIAKAYFPNAKIIIDKYHFVRQVTWAFENVRKRIQKTMSPALRKYYKRSRKLLLARYEELKEDDRQAVDIMLLYNDELRLAHRLKETFYKVCQEKSYKEQRMAFRRWLEYAENSEIKEFLKCCKTFTNWSKEILNAFKYAYTNGPTEGFNNKIKVLKRVSYGIKNFPRFRNRILHTST